MPCIIGIRNRIASRLLEAAGAREQPAFIGHEVCPLGETDGAWR